MKSILLWVCFLMAFGFHSQSHAQTAGLRFSLSFGLNNLQLCDSFTSNIDSNTIEITTLKFYISNIELTKNGLSVFKEKDKYHLLDASKENSLNIDLEIADTLKFDSLLFDIGIDSVTNISGALGGDLDPTKGMYWTWQSGYINFKLEGRSIVCNTRNNAFTFHLGGYQFPFNTLQKVDLHVGNYKYINIDFDIKEWVNTFDLKITNQIMSPNEKAVELSKNLSKCFRILHH